MCGYKNMHHVPTYVDLPSKTTTMTTAKIPQIPQIPQIPAPVWATN